MIGHKLMVVKKKLPPYSVGNGLEDVISHRISHLEDRAWFASSLSGNTQGYPSIPDTDHKLNVGRDQR
jgi:hypothetical protein